MKNEITRMSITLTVPQREKLQAYTNTTGIPGSFLIRQLIDKHYREHPEEFKGE